MIARTADCCSRSRASRVSPSITGMLMSSSIRSTSGSAASNSSASSPCCAKRKTNSPSRIWRRKRCRMSDSKSASSSTARILAGPVKEVSLAGQRACSPLPAQQTMAQRAARSPGLRSFAHLISVRRSLDHLVGTDGRPDIGRNANVRHDFPRPKRHPVDERLVNCGEYPLTVRPASSRSVGTQCAIRCRRQAAGDRRQSGGGIEARMEDYSMGWSAGKVALVTGGGSGIGRAVVARFVEEGAQVAVLDRVSSRTQELRAELGDKVLPLAGDVTQFADNKAAVAGTVAAFGGLDVFVGNAGVFDVYAPLAEFPEEQLSAAFDELFAVNVKGCIFGAKAVLPELIKTAGSIVFTASVAGA